MLADRSFEKHREHVVERRAACATCHDPHGVSGGNPANNHALINFDTAVVGPSASGVLRYERIGEFRGRCHLTCHGADHSPKEYGR